MTHRTGALNRRRLVQASAAIAGTAGMSGIPKLAAASPSSTSPERLTAQDGTQVRALMWTNGPIIDGHFEDRVAAFNEAHAGEITVNLEFLPWDQVWQKLQLAYASGDIYDVYFWDVQAFGHFKRDLIMNLQPMIDEAGALDPAEYPVDLFEPWRLDGENLYAMPENFQTVALYYNKELFDADGLDYPTDQWTYDDYIAAGKTLTKREGDRVNQWGVNLGNLAIWWGMQTVSWAKGDAFFDQQLEPTTAQFSTPANVETLDFVRSLVHDHQIGPKPSVATQSSDITGFSSGRVGMVIDGSWSISGFAELPFEWGIAPIPLTEGERVVPYWMGGWVIARESEVAEAAFEWARWSSDEYQDQMAAEHDWIPVKTSARDSDVTTQDMPEGYRAVIDALQEARIGDIYSDNFQQVWVEVLDPNITQLLEENLDPAEVAARMDEGANALLEG